MNKRIKTGLGLLAIFLGGFLFAAAGTNIYFDKAYCLKSFRVKTKRKVSIWGIINHRESSDHGTEITDLLARYKLLSAERKWVPLIKNDINILTGGSYRNFHQLHTFQMVIMSENMAGLRALFRWNKQRALYLLRIFLDPKAKSNKMGTSNLATFATCTRAQKEKFYKNLVTTFSLKNAP